MCPRSVDEPHQAVLATAKELLAKKLDEGTAGNVWATMADGNVCITPSSVDCREMALDDLLVIHPFGEVVQGSPSPSSEMALHLATCIHQPHPPHHPHAHHAAGGTRPGPRRSAHGIRQEPRQGPGPQAHHRAFDRRRPRNRRGARRRGDPQLY